MDMDFDGVLGWLRDHLGRPVVAAAQGTDGNTTLTVRGPLLHVDDGEITLIDPAPGRVDVWAVGGATLVLLEGDLTEAGTTDFGTGQAKLLQARFGADLHITVAELPEG
jgi:hypothetical protein